LEVELRLYLRPTVRLVAVDVGDAIGAGEFCGGDRSLIPPRPILVGGHRGDATTDVSR
jgi:hypothetical protein